MVTKCQHKYCRGCLAQLLHTTTHCAVCKELLQQVTGNQPSGGKMLYKIQSGDSISGYETHGTIIITYEIPKGYQGPTHPHPGRQFTSKTFTAYLPDCPEGREVLSLLQRAFNAKLLFTISQSDAVIWSDIEHKTNKHGGSKQ